MLIKGLFALRVYDFLKKVHLYILIQDYMAIRDLRVLLADCGILNFFWGLLDSSSGPNNYLTLSEKKKSLSVRLWKETIL